MKQLENAKVSTGHDPNIRSGPRPTPKSMVGPFGEHSVWRVSSLVAVTFFIYNTMGFCIFTLRDHHKSNKIPGLMQNIALGENKPAAKSKFYRGFIVPIWEIRLFLEHVRKNELNP